MTRKEREIFTDKGTPFLQGANWIDEGYNFTVEVPEGGSATLLLYRKGEKKPRKEIPFPEENKVGNVLSIKVKGLSPGAYEYNYRINGVVCQDPYAYSIQGRTQFGEPMDEDIHKIRCGFLPSAEYNWEGDKNPQISYEDMILYKLHVRGYTKLVPNIGRKKGTFSGLVEMIPYWKELGINAVELMPAYEFQEVAPKVRKDAYMTQKKDKDRINYWGYTSGYYFAPKRAYCAGADVHKEFCDFIKAMHKAGIECIMEFCFTEDTSPLLALRALQFWRTFYHVDGFHIQGNGTIQDLALKDGILSGTKIMLSGYDFSSLYHGKVPEKRVFAEYNRSFLEDMRRFLKSDEGMNERAVWHVRHNGDYHGVVNFITCHDGFTLNDLVSYNYKHNEANGEDNEDGSSYNYSWNCGVEGNSRKLSIRQMRERQMRNAFLMMFLSQGVPMIYGGDEIANSQEGNNNAWCQDNPVGWTEWKGLKKNESLLRFVKEAIAFRKEHPILHGAKELKGTDYLAKGYPDISFHGERAWYVNYENTSRLFGVMYFDAYEKEDKEIKPVNFHNGNEFIYVGYNFHWENRKLALPNLPDGYYWRKVADTGHMIEESCFVEDGKEYKKTVEADPRTIVILIGRQEAKK